MARRGTPGAATHRHKDTLAGRQEGCTRAKVTAPRPGLSTIPTVPSDRWTKGLRHSDSLFSRCHEHVVLQHPLIWQDCALPSCRIHTPRQWPALRELPSEVLPSKEQSQGWGSAGFPVPEEGQLPRPPQPPRFLCVAIHALVMLDSTWCLSSHDPSAAAVDCHQSPWLPPTVF